MKSKEVLKLLQISRQTLTKWVKLGKISVKELPNGYYEYSDNDVYKIFNGNVQRKTFIYGRVSTNKQKQSLDTQIETLKQFCFMNGYKVACVYKDIASGIDFTKREQFFEMLDEVIQGSVERVVISYKDRLSRIAFSLFVKLFKKFGCEIVVMSEVGNPKLDSEEVFDEIISLLHCYSMKLYSKRNKDKNSIEVGFDE